MPCYDPPPPWENKQRKNAEQATRLLCGMVRASLATMPREVLEWFVVHREIDLEIATTPYYGKPNPKDAEDAKADIASARAILGA